MPTAGDRAVDARIADLIAREDETTLWHRSALRRTVAEVLARQGMVDPLRSQELP